MKMVTKVEHLGKQAETPQNEGKTAFKESSIYKTLRPNFLFLSIFGMYYERHMKARGKVGGITPGMVYSGVVLMMMTANCLRFLAAFKVGEPFSEVLMMKIVFEVWFVQGAASVFVFFNACRNGSFIELLTAWKACKDTNPCNDKGTSSVLLKVVLFGISVLVVMMNVTMLGIIMFSQGISKISDYAYLMYSPFPNDGGAGEMIGKVMCLMVHALNSVAWIVPINLFYLLCNLLTYEFKLFNQALDDHVDDNGVIKGDMERFRKWHYSLTCLTGMLNDTFSTFTACTYITNFPLAVMILYMLVWPSERDLLYTVFTCIWLGADLFHMCMVTYAGGTLVSHVSIYIVYSN